MAIFGAGSQWDDEQKENFIRNENFVVGWDFESAKDIYTLVGSLKAGDIIYLKASPAGSRNIRIKAIGVVKTSVINHIIQNSIKSSSLADWNSFSIPIKWIITEQFFIEIPPEEGKLTNIRSSTFYEENLPYVQEKILNKLYNLNFKNYYMDYGLGQFITGILATSLQIFSIYRDTRNIEMVRETASNFNTITTSQIVIEEGRDLENLIPGHVLNTLKNRVEMCWSDFNDALANPNITPTQLDRYATGLKECICRELKVIFTLNGTLPNSQLQNYWNQYKCNPS
jgi:hypothetical protein